MEILWKVDMFSSTDTQRENITNSGDNAFRSPFEGRSETSSPPKAIAREMSLIDISEFEENRCLSNESHMSRNELYWNELVKMQEEAVADNDQFLHYLRVKSSALVAFSDSLNAIQVEHISRGRYHEQFNDNASLKDASNDQSVQQSGPGQRARYELVQLDRLWAQRVSSLAESMHKDIIQPFEVVRKAFLDDITAMGRRCANLFHAVRLSDMRAQCYFAAIENCSQNSPVRVRPVRRNSGTSFNSRASSISITRSTSSQSLGPLLHCHNIMEDSKDLWLTDMCYRVAVVRHLQMKEECSRQLGRLLVRAKEAEGRRREAIAKATEQLKQMQLGLWQQLPEDAASTADACQPPSRTTDSCDISTILRERVAASQALAQLPILRQLSVVREETKDARERDETGRLASPLDSPLLSRCAVFLRRDGGPIVASWMPVMLFLTTDRWLHVFDLDPKCERMTEIAAFHTLVSSSKKGLELSVSSLAHGSLCEETEFDPKTSIQLLKNEAFMSPTNSLMLSRCKVSCQPAVNDTTFELIEAVPNTGMGAMFKATVDRRYVFRSRSVPELADWILLLNSADFVA